jgi:pyridoxine 4-dehydrogenase
VNLRMLDPSQTPGDRFEAQLAALVKVREEGLIGGVALSNVSRRQMLRAVGQTEIACVRKLFNLTDQRCLDVRTEWESRAGGTGRPLHATPIRIALAWLFELAPGILLIPGSRNRAHLAQNLADVGLGDAARAGLRRHLPLPDSQGGDGPKGITEIR